MKNLNTLISSNPDISGTRKKSRKVTNSTTRSSEVKVSKLLKLLDVEEVAPTSVTDNGALSFKATGSKVLDFFSKGGALDNKTDAEITSLFRDAFKENALLATKALFYFRDIRGGQGKRKTFRTILRWVANQYPNVVKLNLGNIPFYGRYDDLFELFGTPVEKAMLTFVNNQLALDLSADESKGITLLGKWMPSENTSSQKAKDLARRFQKFFGLTSRNYRKMLSFLRNKINVLERQLCANQWGEIDYAKVPSRASMIYRKAFSKHDGKRYVDFLSKVEKGEAKINASTLYPHELVLKVIQNSDDSTIEALWKALPNYLEGNEGNRLVVADVSGSMQSGIPRAIDVCVSLALYLAERNEGMFKDYFITFSENPSLQKITGESLRQKVGSINSAHWGFNTNLQSVFDLILNTAVENKLKKSEMPEQIIIISDMQFDQACRSNKRTNFQEINSKFKKAKYKRPTLVFWNVNASLTNTPVTSDSEGSILISGFSPSIMKSLLSGKEVTPYDQMIETLNSSRYSIITV